MNDSHAADLWNTLTLRRLDETGIGPGWRCLEIGADVDDVANWMLQRVGSSGTVVVADIGTRLLDPTVDIEVRHHQTPEAVDRAYDLIHGRLVFERLPQRTAVLAEMVAVLRPGGFLVLEDYDTRAMHRRGIDLTCGLQLPRLLRDAGLTEITAEKRAVHADPRVSERPPARHTLTTRHPVGLMPTRCFEQTIAVLASASDTNGLLGAVEVAGPRGAVPPLHVHHHEDEAFYVVEGDYSVYIGDEVIKASRGTWAWGPRDVPHGYQVHSERGRHLSLVMPGGREAFFEEVAAIAKPSDEPRNQLTRLTAIAARYGVELLGPVPR